MRNGNLKPRGEVLKRLQGFINDTAEAIQLGIFTTMHNMVVKYGISAGFPTFLTEKGLFILTGGNNRRYFKYAVRKDFKPVTLEEVDTLRKEFNLWTYNRKNGVPAKPVTKAESKFQHVSTDELIRELRKRGYEGRLFIKKEIKV